MPQGLGSSASLRPQPWLRPLLERQATPQLQQVGPERDVPCGDPISIRPKLSNDVSTEFPRALNPTQAGGRGDVSRALSPIPSNGHRSGIRRIWLVGRRKDFWLLELHGDAAALDLAITGLDAEDLGGAGRTLESFAELVGHPRLLALLLHGHAAALQCTVAAFGDDHLGVALGALISLADLVRHRSSPVLRLWRRRRRI